MVESVFSVAESPDPIESTEELLPKEMIVGVSSVGAIALRVMVPTLVVVWIAFVVSDPMDRDMLTAPLVAKGPSRVVGKAA